MNIIVIIFVTWAIGFIASTPLSLIFIMNNSVGMSQDEIDFLIPTSVFFGMVFSWIWMFIMLVLVLRDFIRSFSSKDRKFVDTFNNKAFRNRIRKKETT